MVLGQVTTRRDHDICFVEVILITLFRFLDLTSGECIDEFENFKMDLQLFHLSFSS